MRVLGASDEGGMEIIFDKLIGQLLTLKNVGKLIIMNFNLPYHLIIPIPMEPQSFQLQISQLILTAITPSSPVLFKEMFSPTEEYDISPVIRTQAPTPCEQLPTPTNLVIPQINGTPLKILRSNPIPIPIKKKYIDDPLTTAWSPDSDGIELLSSHIITYYNQVPLLSKSLPRRQIIGSTRYMASSL